MNLSVSSAFDGGNIRLVAIEGSRVDLEIVKDHQSDFYQWFYFRLSGAAAQPEIEPLVEIGLVILDDFKVDSAAFDGDQANVAAIEGARY